MRQWQPRTGGMPAQLVQQLIPLIGQPAFASGVLTHLQALLPAASCAVYQTGKGCVPTLFMSSSLGIPDTTRDCWRAYLSGPHLQDKTFPCANPDEGKLLMCHITAQEVSATHRSRVYDRHGVAERVSVLQHRNDAVFAINLYRHAHQAPFQDHQLSDLEALAPVLLSLAEKQIELSGQQPIVRNTAYWSQRLAQSGRGLTTREIEVCARLLKGMTQEGISLDLGLRLSSVKTYRNRAFTRLGIHFKNELFALFAH